MSTEPTETFAEIGTPANPFPGLRPFEFNESQLFFGREGQSEQLIGKLSRTRFLAVVGTSGSGKSSLVRAGLLPALLGGFMTSAGSGWRIAILRPANDPIGNIARALNAPDVFGSEIEENARIQTAITKATLRRGSLGLVDAVRQAVLPENENLLVVVDQFEETFRFAEDSERQNEAAAFVKLFLEASRQRELPIYVVLTMRSDYLGECAQFWELPEAINESQYLIPRLTRDQLRQAIMGPVAVGGGKITQRLVNRLLNDVGENQDQLPILQHALMRSWDQWKGHQEELPETPIDLVHYEAIGGMSEALSRHAEEAFNELPDDRSREVAEKLFKSLTEKGPDNREIRRPLTLGEICVVADATPDEVITVIDTFRQPGRSFLIPPSGVPLNSESLIDISHESLIRNWQQLKEWVEEESRSARIYRRLAETAALYPKEAGLWRDPDLQMALNWREESHPNKMWARRYHPGFDEALSFLDASVTERDEAAREAESRRRAKVKSARRFAIVFGLAFLATLAALVYAYYKGVEAKRLLKVAFEEAEKNERLLYTADINLAWQAYETNNFTSGLELLERYLPNSGRSRPPGYEWYYLWRIYHQDRATLRGHAASVYSVAFSPDGKMLATASRDQTVKLWDTTSRQELATLRGHTDSVTSVAFSPDGKMLASAGSDKTVKLWDTTSRQELATLRGHTDLVTSVAFSPDGKMLASAGYDRVVQLWETGSHHPIAKLLHASPIRSVAFSPDGMTLAAGSADGLVKLWDTSSHQELITLKGHTDKVSSMAFSPNGRTLATAGYDKMVRLWHGATDEEVAASRK